jgi:hypothetical protein
MIPEAEVEPYIARPLPPCAMPNRNEITEEGFGFFRGTWFIGRVPVEEAEAVVQYEQKVIDALGEAAAGPEEFEQLAKAVEDGYGGELPDALAEVFASSGLAELADWDGDLPPLYGLEIGVAGLTCALSAIRCLTAASCRWHIDERSWSDCPVVFFASPDWRVEILAQLVASANCGLDADRDMLKVFGSSIRDTHTLARTILEERGRFRKMPNPPQRSRRSKLPDALQLELFEDRCGAQARG